MTPNRRIRLASIPNGMTVENDFSLEETSVPACPQDGLLLRTLWISVDPYLRGRISGVKSYIDPIPVGSTMESSCVGEVIESNDSGFMAGDFVSGLWGWQEYVAIDARKVLKVDAGVAPISTALGILGMPGMTAYFGFTELCSPKAGETVVVSGAAGAVGSAVGQIAKILGCRVVGTAGTEGKVNYLKTLGFDGAINYRDHRPIGEVLAELCPDGIDCYFDNVGGEITDAVIGLMNVRGRVAVCGQISQYNDWSQDLGLRPFGTILTRQLRVEGFIVSRWAKQFDQGRSQMAEWLREGKLQYEETIYEGLESAPEAFIGLFRGENTGKALVRLA